MFGFGLKSKAKRIIRNHFAYEVSYIGEATFNLIYRQGVLLNQNEFSIAIQYMLVMMNLLVENYLNNTDISDSKEVEDFIQKHTSNINRIIHLANSPEADIRNLIDEVTNRFQSAIPQETQDFEDLGKSKKDVSSLSIDEDGEGTYGHYFNEDDVLEDNPFAIGDIERDELLKKMKSFSIDVLQPTKLYIENCSSDELMVISAIQLFGALDYEGQQKGWTLEQLMEPFSAILKDEPFNKEIGEAFKLLRLFRTTDRTLEIIQLQVVGAGVFGEFTDTKVSNELSVIAEKNRESLTKLMTPLFTKILFQSIKSTLSY